MPEDGEQQYMTVGELADKVGVTVRTIQYYDQEKSAEAVGERQPQSASLHGEG